MSNELLEFVYIDKLNSRDIKLEIQFRGEIVSLFGLRNLLDEMIKEN